MKDLEKIAERAYMAEKEKGTEWLGDDEAFIAGYIKGFETKINTTTISDCPLPDGENDVKIRMLSQKVYDLQKENGELKEKIRLAAEQDARDIRSRFPC